MFTLDRETTYLGAALVCASIGGLTDGRCRRIPNWLTAPSILLGLMLHLVLGGWRDMAASAVAGLLAGGIFLLFFLAGGMGGGDVKLITAVCCLAGISQTVCILIATSLLGGVFRHRACACVPSDAGDHLELGRLGGASRSQGPSPTSGPQSSKTQPGSAYPTAW